MSIDFTKGNKVADFSKVNWNTVRPSAMSLTILREKGLIAIWVPVFVFPEIGEFPVIRDGKPVECNSYDEAVAQGAEMIAHKRKQQNA